MDMEGCYGGVSHGYWSSCRPLASFPMLCSSSQLLMSEHGLPAAAAAAYGDHISLGDCSSALLLRDDETADYLPISMIPPPIAADEHYPLHLLPPAAADGVTADLDDALLKLPFSDIDLDAFGDAGDHKNAGTLASAIVPAGHHHLEPQYPFPLQAIDHRHQNSLGGGGGAVVTGYKEPVIYSGDGEKQNVGPPPPPAARRAGSNVQAAGGRTRLDHIGFEELRRYFYMPITKAAREMNVGLTVLKKRCRELGVARWPHRKMKSLKSLIHNVQEMGKGGMSAAAMQREVVALETYCALMEENPAMGLTERTKKLRQACFKESYKRRRAAAAGDMLDLDHCYAYGGGHQQQLPLPPPPPPVVVARRSQGNSFFELN